MDGLAELIIWSGGVLNGQLPSAVVTIPVKLHGYVGLSGWDGVTVFVDANRDAITAKLKTGWLKSAEEHITDNYGTTGKGRVLTIQFDYTVNAELNTVARMETTMSGNVSLRHVLKLYLKSFVPYEYKNTDGISYDRMIAHELVHGVFNDWVNQTQQPLWFVEGIAEAIHGGLDRYLYLRTNGRTVIQIINSLNPTYSFNYETGLVSYTSNENTSEYYAAAYLAIRYLHDYLKPFGILRIFNRVKSGLSLNAAFNETTPWATTTAFVAYFTGGYMNPDNISSPGSIWTTANIEGTGTSGDTGAFGGFLVDAGPIEYDTTIFDDNLTSEDQPLTGFVVDWQVPEVEEPETVATITAYAQAHRFFMNGASYYYNDIANSTGYQFVATSYTFNENHTALSDLTGHLVDPSASVLLQMYQNYAIFNLMEFAARSQEVNGCVVYSYATKLGVVNPLLLYIDLSQVNQTALTQNTFSFRWDYPPGTMVY